MCTLHSLPVLLLVLLGHVVDGVVHRLHALHRPLPAVGHVRRAHVAAAHVDRVRDLGDFLHLSEKLMRNPRASDALAPKVSQLIEDLLHALHVELGHVLVVAHGLGVVVADDALGRLLHSVRRRPRLVNIPGGKVF